MAGADSVVLLSAALVLVSTLPWVEAWFDGVDRAMIWHRRLAISGIGLLVVHIVTATNPHPSSIGPQLGALGMLGLLALTGWAIVPRWRSIMATLLHGPIEATRNGPIGTLLRHVFGGYERWRWFHRTIGVSVAFGFVHGILDATPFQRAPMLRWSYVAIGAIGLAFYLYRELLARHFKVLHDYEVESVRGLAHGVTEIALRPLDRQMDFQPGQRMMLHLEGKDGWHRHPSTISSAPYEPLLRLSVKALGDYTERAHQIEPGMPAMLSNPMGRFDYRRGGERQLWIVGGIGITPFLSWLRDADHHNLQLPHIELFDSTAGPALFGEEITAIADRHPSVNLHLNDTSTQPRLTGDGILGATAAEPTKLTTFMCGPTAMLRDLRRQLKAAGVPSRQLRHQYFDWR